MRKVHGFKLENLRFSFNPSKQKHLVMVKLVISHLVKNMNGLYISRKVEKSMIRADQGTPDEYEKLKNEVIF